jgi:hypothetical protein
MVFDGASIIVCLMEGKFEPIMVKETHYIIIQVWVHIPALHLL